MIEAGEQRIESTTSSGRHGLCSGFLNSLRSYPERPALEVEGEPYTFEQLHQRAAGLAATLRRHRPEDEPPLTAVFAQRTITAFSGVLGALLRGHGYVPLSRALPPQRTRLMLDRSHAQAVVVDRASAQQLPAVLDGLDHPVLVLAPDHDDVGALSSQLPGHTVLGRSDLEPAGGVSPEPIDPRSLAYLLFTSGSTGTPKGVMVSHANVTGLMAVMADRYAITPSDRVSQTHELTFDVSVLDMFLAWERGACVCCPSQKSLITPGQWIRDTELSVWSSVPSTAILMRRLGMLKPRSFPSLRWSLFAGEPLPVQVADEWLAAAPDSTVENLYGPTEASIVCLGYRWDPQTSHAEAEAGVIPIGSPLASMRARVVDSELREVAPREVGELLICGPQVTPGYWEDLERTATAFVTPPGSSDVHYRTGDRVRRPARGRPMTYLGRLDSQIKVRGVRIELGEVEAAVRDATGVDAVVALGWPQTLTGADGIIAFVGAADIDLEAARERLKARLPAQMLPREIRALERMPLNANGKFDRQVLRRRLEEEA